MTTTYKTWAHYAHYIYATPRTVATFKCAKPLRIFPEDLHLYPTLKNSSGSELANSAINNNDKDKNNK